MKIINIKPAQAQSYDINLIAGSLRVGEVVILPTDTIYGLSCRLSSHQALKRIFALKKRESGKPLINLVSSLAMAKRYALINRRTAKLLRYYWQEASRPTTVILWANPDLSPGAAAPDGSISLRLPKSDFLIKIIRKVGEPLVSTSLNLSGQAPILDLKNIEALFAGRLRPDLAVNSGQSRRRPSRLIDLRGEKVRIIRK